MRWLVRRYLEGFGPATIQDIAQFSTIYRPPVKDAVAALGDELVRLEGPNGEELLDIAGGKLPPEDSPAPPRLLPMWDSTLLAYKDRSRIVPQDYRTLVMRNNGDVLPTLLVDGYVAGVWRPIDGGIEATAFHAIPPKAWKGLEAEARALVGIPGRSRPRRLPPIRPLVGQAAEDRGPSAMTFATSPPRPTTASWARCRVHPARGAVARRTLPRGSATSPTTAASRPAIVARPKTAAYPALP